jgi:hypothetical protein
MTVIEREPAFVAETLAWCNEIRAGKGMEPLACLPKGKRHDPSSCPCGKATGLLVFSFYARERAGKRATRDTTRAVEDFVLAFDRRELPQYEEDAEC